MQSEQLIQDHIELTRQIINRAEKLKSEDLPTLTWRKDPHSWNVLECLEHLNRYGDFYLPEIENKISASATASDPEFKSGLLGGYFAKSMLPNEKLNKMNTFKDKNPLNEKLDKTVIDRFIDQQIKLLDLLKKARKVSLNKVKIQLSITRLLKFKLGDTFCFFVNHILRHLEQIDRIKAEMKKVQ